MTLASYLEGQIRFIGEQLIPELENRKTNAERELEAAKLNLEALGIAYNNQPPEIVIPKESDILRIGGLQ